MISVLFGLASLGAGLWGLYVWRMEFVAFLKGFLPICLVFAGAVAVIMGSAGMAQGNEKD